ncbi:MAG: FAD-binding oxidoreductase [Lentisphaerae bacterium]|nr:FAD-binding oxidoreductase [Lentisphaerota bacterium]
MADDHIPLQPAAPPEMYQVIDRFCAERRPTLGSLAQFLRERCGVELTLDKDIIAGFTQDSSNLPGRAEALCRPTSVRDGALVFRGCFQAGIPFTLSAGKSNLTGSATPEGGVVISTTQLLAPAVTVETTTKTATASAGLILEEMRSQVLERSGRGLIYPIDPTSRSDATVGGTIACNASGFTPGAAGATRPWVAALDVLLPNGLMVHAARGQYVSAQGRFRLIHEHRVIELAVPRYPRPALKNASGPFSAPQGVMDFVDLIVGSEGIFGLVTGCRLRLIDRPRAYLDLFFSLPTETEAVRLHQILRQRLGGDFTALTALEYFGVNSRHYMTHAAALFHGDHQVGINIQAPLRDQAPEDAAEAWLEILRQADCGVDENAILLLDNDRARALFLEARHSMPAHAIEVVQRRGTYTIMTDTVVPPDHFKEFLDYAHQLLRAASMDYLSFGHLGDCHLHFTLLPQKEQLERGRELYDLLVAKSAELGGVYSGEHGTGKRKRADFLRCYGPAAVEEIRRCKAALDPQFLLNRGNVVEP